ncbi:TonB-dependent receptor domain-containing protein [Segatella bryantii]|uniref:TonB-dependent receptor n=1 Tax=Segatella bryantii TaxID=77095 RepID=A0ABX4EHQ9_SEGBR|nr:TonB-dependent receptor [Segatella bryantii]OYP55491.1 hypothetical protein CIK91_06440 [Segatella bryantii]UKK81894.1 TonB-dependent receptor [Segatella bryantii]
MICSLALSMLSAIPQTQATNDTVKHVVNLKEVNITASHKIDDKGGKIVYNAYLDKVRSETSAIELMRKVPMLSVDMNGNVSIRGNSNIKILVNGHSYGILSSTQILEQLSPADIQKVEVMTTPGAKYEAQGTGGIVNIITHRRMYFKSSGYLNTGVGTKGSHLMGNFNYAVDKHWAFQNSFYGLFGYSETTSNSNFSDSKDGKNTSQIYCLQTGALRSDNKSILNLKLLYMYQGAFYKEKLASGENKKTNNEYHYLSASIDYSWTASEIVKMNAQTQWYYLPTRNKIGDWDNLENKTGTYILGQMSQIDCTLKPWQKLEFDVGLSNNYSHFKDVYRSTMIRYINNLGAYSELKYEATPLLTINGGLRYEYYHIDTDLKRKRKYNDLFYNLGINYKTSPFCTLSLLFSRRTDRPTYSTLLSEGNYQGGNVILYGNSNVESSYSYLLEAGTSLYVGDCFFKISPYYRYTDKSISLMVQKDNNVMQQYAVNIDGCHSWGSEIWSTLVLMNGKLNFNGGMDIKYKKLKDHGISNSGWQLQYSMNVTYRFFQTLYVNCYGSWQNRKIYLQGSENSYLYSNLSVQKSWHDDHYRLALSVDNPFSNGVNVKRDYCIDGKEYHSSIRYRNTGIRVFFIYKFGKHDMEKDMQIEQNILNNY